jgi:uncharacterized membrane protein
MQIRIVQKLEFKMNKTFSRVLGGVSLLALSVPSFAAIDVTAATAGVADAQTAVLVILGLMITMAAAIYGVQKVRSLLGR